MKRDAAQLPSASPAAQPPGPAPQRPSWSVLILLCVAEFMVVLDITVVNVALPSIGRALHFAPASLPWVVTVYVLLTGGLTLLGGRASDLLGRRRVFLAGLAVFTAGSLASGLAPSAGALIASRAAQGVGAALLTPAALAIITATYTGAQRDVALSAWGALGSGGAAVGVLAGGVLTTWLGWRSVFLINVPVGLAAGILALGLVRPAPPAVSGRTGLDLPGALLAVAGLVVLTYSVSGAPQYGWGSARTLLLLALAAGLLGAFAVAERLARRPLLPPPTWRNRSLAGGALVMLGATGIMVGSFYLNSLFLQNVLGASPVKAGVEFLPFVLAIGAAAQLASRLLPRAGTRALAAAGLAVMTAGALLLMPSGAHTGYLTGLLPGYLILGFGVGLVFPAASVAAMSRVSGDATGLASGLMTTAHEVGAAVGVAVFSAVAAAAAGYSVTGAGFAAGYRNGLMAAASVAAGLAIVALLALPPARSARGGREAVR